MHAFFPRYGFAALLGALASMACGTGPVGAENPSETDTTVVTDNPVRPEDTDDTPPPIAPFDPSLTYNGRYGSQNHSDRRFQFDVAPFRSDAEKADAEILYPSHAAHMAAHASAIPSVQTVGTYAKQLDDTIYAGIERAMQAGVDPIVASKRAILTGAIAYLTSHRDAAGDAAIARLGAALSLGGATPSIPPDLASAVDAEKSAFLAKPDVAKPYGFYTWSEDLRAIWQQDRLLQQPLTASGASCALARAIAADDARKAQYVALVSLYGRLTNPVKDSLVDLLASTTCDASASRPFLGTSASVEVALFNELYPDGIPEGANLMKDLIDAIRSGSIDLAPKAEDGWYQYQEYALETLLVTDKSEERAKIAFMSHYKKRLIEAFETMITQHRETHAKQLDTVGTAGRVEPETPTFRVEPLATVYVRHARSYVFLESALDAVLGTKLLDAAPALGADGPQKDTLRARIHRTRDLYFGLYLDSMQDLGLHPKLDASGDPDPTTWDALAKAADAWALDLAKDPIAASDVRVAVPIAQLGNGRARYWVTIGVRTTLAGYSYINGASTAPAAPDLQTRVPLPTEQFLEVDSSSTPIDRDELRALCDQAKTADAIKAALEAR